jgi:hypothetical protein
MHHTIEIVESTASAAFQAQSVPSGQTAALPVAFDAAHDLWMLGGDAHQAVDVRHAGIV